MLRCPLLLTAILVAAQSLFARTAAAQDIRGVVRDGTTGAAIGGAVAMILDANRQTLARTLTSTNGAFRLLNSPGGVTFRVIRIGYAPHETPLARLAPSPVTISMTLLGRVMERVSVRANPICPSRADQQEALALWSAATDALLAMVVASVDSSQTGVVRQLLYNRLMEPGGRRIAHQASRRVVTGNVSPIRADRPPQAFVDSGYVVTRGDVMTYYGPDAQVLLDSSFAETHCLSLRQDGRLRPGQLGVAFAPPRSRAIPDIAGVLWLTREPLALRTLEFEYRSVDQSIIDMRGGGRLEFETLANGVPVITSWLVRSPRLAWLPAGTRLRGRTIRENEVSTIHEVYETGGLLVSGQLADGTRWSAPLATLGGRVLTVQSGTPASGAQVSLDSTDQVAVTDSAGEFAFHELLPGPHVLRAVDTVTLGVRIADSATMVLADTTLQQRITRIATQSVEIRSATTAPIEVRLPWRESINGCGSQDVERRFFVMGVVMTPDSTPVEYAQVRLGWSENVRGGAVETLVDTRSNGDGAFFVCGIPAERELATQVSLPMGEELSPGSLRIPRTERNPDGSESRFRSILLTVPLAGGANPTPIERPASVAGIVLDSTGAPFPGVTVRLGGTPFSTVAGADGGFRLDSLPIGQFTLVAEHQSYRQAGSPVASAPVELRAGAAGRQTLRAAGTVQLVRRICGGRTPGSESGTVRVVVTDSATARPLSGLPVWLRWAGRFVGSDLRQMQPSVVGGSETVTDASGGVAFCDVPGDMNLWFSALRPDGKAAADSIALRVQKGELRVFQVKTSPPR